MRGAEGGTRGSRLAGTRRRCLPQTPWTCLFGLWSWGAPGAGGCGMCLGLQKARFPTASLPAPQICSKKPSSVSCRLQPGCLCMAWSTQLGNGRGRWILGLSSLYWGPQSPPTCKPKDNQPRARYWASRRSCWRIQTCRPPPPYLFAGHQGPSPSPCGGIQHSTLSGQVEWMSPPSQS